MFAVYTEAEQNIQNATGPIDDGYITNVVGALPGDALCCEGPEKLEDGMSTHTCREPKQTFLTSWHALVPRAYAVSLN